MIFRNGRVRQAKRTAAGSEKQAPARTTAVPGAIEAGATEAAEPPRSCAVARPAGGIEPQRSRAVAGPAGTPAVSDPGSAPSDPLADDLIRRVLAAIEGWTKANGLTALPAHIAFEQALSILNAMDRSFLAGDRE
jgi:hypothetical protein